MSDQYLGEIRPFGFSYAPAEWLLCDGQLLPISQYSALFGLLGTNFGGNGTTNFALPDLRGAFPIGQGLGAGLTSRLIGERGGTESVTLTVSEIPAHSHNVQCTAGDGLLSPGNAVFGGGGRGKQPAYAATSTQANMAPGAVSVIGGNQPHENRPPFVVVTYCIAVNGIFPTRG